MPHRGTVHVVAAYYRPSSVVCMSDRIASPAKTAEPIKMPFRLCQLVCFDEPKESRVRWGPDFPWNGQFCGKGTFIVKYRDFLPCAVEKNG